ncbi:hypothetical protein JL49_15730 [Pseudoalteromonas luteoviolacea]|nr:hypothetical protein JL49_15730 [Pseudoalteromonas luteoviolacea]
MSNLKYGNSESGMPSESDLTDKMLYQLACIFFGSSGFSENTSSLDCLIELRNKFQEAEANVLLVSLAATIRRRSESISEYEKTQIVEMGLKEVGEYCKNKDTNSNTMPLTFREACNKIIHADQLEFSYAAKFGELLPKVHLLGSQQGREWSATVDINLYIQSAWHHG